jgi:hypothetical protein
MARESSHRFQSPEALHQALLYNFVPEDGGGDFDQVYTFPRSEPG